MHPLISPSYVTALHARIPVTIHDPSSSVLSTGMKRFESWLDKDVAKGRLTKDQAGEAKERIRGVKGDGTEGEVMKDDTDLVIEVDSVFRTLDLALSPKHIANANRTRPFQRFPISKLACSSDSLPSSPLRRFSDQIPVPSLLLVSLRLLNLAHLKRQSAWSGESVLAPLVRRF